MSVKVVLEDRCRALLDRFLDRVGGKIDYGLEEWLTAINNLEKVDSLGVVVAYEIREYPAELSRKLVKQAQLKGMSPGEQFEYISGLNSTLKKLMSLCRK